MEQNLRGFEKLYHQTLEKMRKDGEYYRQFLRSSAQWYQHDFPTQVMVYAQQPNGIKYTHIGSETQWNRVGRTVLERQKPCYGIGVQNTKAVLKRWYDVSQTHGKDITGLLDVGRVALDEYEWFAVQEQLAPKSKIPLGWSFFRDYADSLSYNDCSWIERQFIAIPLYIYRYPS